MFSIPTTNYLNNLEEILNTDTKNFKASTHKFPDQTKLLNELFLLFQSLPDSLDTYPRDKIAILQMYWSTFRCFIISSVLVLQTHISESYALISKATESTASARKMFLHPHLIDKWINRKNNKDSQSFRRILGILFPIEDKLIYPEIFEIYNLSTDHGRHPNFESTIFFSDFKKINIENKVFFTYTDLEDEGNLSTSTTYIIYVYFKLLFVYKEMFTKFLAKEWIENFKTFELNYLSYINTFRENLKKQA